MISDVKALILSGIAASPGIAFGEARVVYSWEQSVEERIIAEDQVDEEIARLDRAIEESLVELEKWIQSAGQKLGGPLAKIFEAQLMIASDQEFLSRVKLGIKSGLKSAEYIYSQEVEKTIAPLKSSKDHYMRQMAADIEAVSSRIIRRLTGQPVRYIGQAPRESIFVGKAFTPGEVLNLYERKVKAIVTSTGGPNSHMALIARSLLIPTVVGVPEAHLRIISGDRLVVDGDKGQVTLHPSQSVWNDLRKKTSKFSAVHILKLDRLPYFPPRTTDGYEVDVAVNIDLPGPIDQILAEHRVGVGLYRTEFVYLQSGAFPSENQQFRIYDSVASRYYPRQVVIRTFDLGSDKYYKSGNMVRESNPALGWRGIRAAFDMPSVFRNQIKAILRASTRKNVKILLPMIADIDEYKKALGIIKRAMASLKKKQVPFDDDMDVGAMIEVPSAAMAADILAQKAAFFSIGSNDLTQYTLAADRDNQKLVKIHNPLHPAVLKLIHIAVSAAKKHNIPTAICGEMSGDILAIPLLIGIGIDQLSMNPSKLYNACRLISRISRAEAINVAKHVMQLDTLREVQGFLLDYNMSVG
jgi:phosphotransferase system enzyme I (PtsI)